MHSCEPAKAVFVDPTPSRPHLPRGYGIEKATGELPATDFRGAA
jgi:hypothetical protein